MLFQHFGEDVADPPGLTLAPSRKEPLASCLIKREAGGEIKSHEEWQIDVVFQWVGE